MKYIFGPVISRRLGFSLGIDFFPEKKICSMDCLYCECGKTFPQCLTLERREWAPTKEIIEEIELFLKENRDIPLDYITFSGNGEPTLHKDFGKIAQFIKEILPDIKLALITNSSLLWKEEVLKDLKYFDLVLPSLDAVEEKIFKRINHPAKGLKISHILEGLEKLKENFSGEIWLETLFVKGINDSAPHIEALGKFIHHLKPTRWQINTVARPPAYKLAKPLSTEELISIAKKVNYYPTDIISSDRVLSLNNEEMEFPKKSLKEIEETLKAIIKRRPSPEEELLKALGIPRETFEELIEKLQKEGIIKVEIFNGKKYILPYQVKKRNG